MTTKPVTPSNLFASRSNVFTIQAGTRATHVTVADLSASVGFIHHEIKDDVVHGVMMAQKLESYLKTTFTYDLAKTILASFVEEPIDSEDGKHMLWVSTNPNAPKRVSSTTKKLEQETAKVSLSALKGDDKITSNPKSLTRDEAEEFIQRCDDKSYEIVATIDIGEAIIMHPPTAKKPDPFYVMVKQVTTKEGEVVYKRFFTSTQKGLDAFRAYYNW